TSWTLDFIWVHGHRYRAQEASYGINFSSAEEMTGTAGCASFTADYDVTDESIRINRFRTSTYGCDEDEVGSLFLEYLPAASDLTVTDETLEIEAGDQVQLVFRR
ncbi:MAG: heat shock protein HslJ, partial [Rhodothermales bacterium]